MNDFQRTEDAAADRVRQPASTQGWSTPDLTTCDREPIHIPGSIQPHGILFGLAGDDLRIVSVSANVVRHFGHEPHSILGGALSRLLDAASCDAVSAAISQNVGTPGQLVHLSLLGGHAAPLRALVHTTPEGVLLEVELPPPPDELSVAELSAADLLQRFDGATRRLQAATDVATICTDLAHEVRRLTGYDRVKVYRFAADWTGEVIAESNRGNLPSYLGLHFPATDIPVQARALFARYPERQIPDVGYVPVPLVGRTPLDLSQAMLRSVSPVHIEYLRNMGVGASMSLSIMRQGALWGVVACHNETAHYLSPELRQASLLLTQLAAWQLAVAEDADIARRSVGVKAVERMLLQASTSGHDYREALLSKGGELLDLLQATGFALCHGSSVTTLGETPPDEALRELLDWIAGNGSDLFETDHLATHYPMAASLGGSAGLLAVSLGGAAKNLMVWFRPELARDVTWGGNPNKPAEPAAGEVRLSPRKSFAAWTERVHGHSRPWEQYEIAAANSLRDMIVDIILRRSAELEQMNTQLTRTNEELEAFAYVASHDLKEPLRQIETFGTLLERIFRREGRTSSDATRWFDGIQSSSRRLRTLINDLAEYSRIGRHANPFAPAALTELLDDVQVDLGQLLKETGATVEVGPLPAVMCDRTQMRQVMQNILANAVKYRHPDRAPVIGFSAVVTGASGSTPPAMPLLELCIGDNGIGLDERYREQIFEPFQRLHSADECEGSGIGLAICRKIIERHRGTISVTSCLGHGSIFKIILPMRPLADPSATQ